METMFIFLAFLVGLFFGAVSVLLWMICYAIGRGSREEGKDGQARDRAKHKE